MAIVGAEMSFRLCDLSGRGRSAAGLAAGWTAELEHSVSGDRLLITRASGKHSLFPCRYLYR